MNTAASPPADVWVDERLVVRDSPIDGRGLFVTHAVPAGTVVIRLAGRLVTSAELDALIAAAEADPAAPYVDTITIDDDVHLVLPPDTTIHFGNHSCDPTLWHAGPYERTRCSPGPQHRRGGNDRLRHALRRRTLRDAVSLPIGPLPPQGVERGLAAA